MRFFMLLFLERNLMSHRPGDWVRHNVTQDLGKILEVSPLGWHIVDWNCDGVRLTDEFYLAPVGIPVEVLTASVVEHA